MALESHFIIGKSYLPDSKSKLKQTEFRGERERRDRERKERRREKDRGGKEERSGGKVNERKNPETFILFRCFSLNLCKASFAQ